MCPYRTPAAAEPPPQPTQDHCPDGDLVWLFVVLSLLSIGRVGAGVAGRETCGVTATLAVLGVLLGPWLLWPAARWAALRTPLWWRCLVRSCSRSTPRR